MVEHWTPQFEADLRQILIRYRMEAKPSSRAGFMDALQEENKALAACLQQIRSLVERHGPETVTINSDLAAAVLRLEDLNAEAQRAQRP
jgi:hypothetical protein